MKDKKIRRIPYGDVNIGQPHFIISYSSMGDSLWREVGLLYVANDLDDSRLTLLTHDFSDLGVIEKMQREVSFYLFELKHTDKLAYLVYHCSTLSNVYSDIHFSFVENISKSNILYYLITSCKLAGIYDNVKVAELEHRYVDYTIEQVFKNALYKEYQYDISEYNDSLLFLYSIFYDEMPSLNGFSIVERHTIVEFSQFLAGLTINEFCNVLNYLNKNKAIKYNKLTRLLQFYYENFQLNKNLFNQTAF